MRRIPGLFLLACLSTLAHAEGFTLTSPDIAGQLASDQVHSDFGCKGGNRSPALHWHDAPAGTQSFAVTVYDPDAPTGSGWWHWLIFDIPASEDGLARNAGDPDGGRTPKGSIQGTTDFGRPGYGGACPPAGDRPHRYVFTVHALDTAHLGLEAGTPPAMVGFMIRRHTLARASLIAYYGR